MIWYDTMLRVCGTDSDLCKFFAGGMTGTSQILNSLFFIQKCNHGILISIKTGVLSWMSIIYLDVVKSRIQADDPINPKYNGMIDTFKKCYWEGGIKIFGRGLVIMSIRAFPVNGATFVG